jgi:thioredoxin reductase
MSAASSLPVVVIGAGPVGLSAAVQLLDRGLDVIVLEASDAIAASLRDWGHVRLFSPWRHNVDKTAARLLKGAGWASPPADALPTGDELVHQYLRPLAELSQLHDRIRLGRRVTAITRAGVDKTRSTARADVPFVVRTDAEDITARAVIDASGTWWTPNPVGAAGIPARGESALARRIHYGIPDVLGRHRDRHAGKTTLVVGAGHSAANTLIALAELARTTPGTAVRWATRSADLTRVFGGGDADGLPARGKLGTELRALIDAGGMTMIERFQIESVREVDGKLEIAGLRAGEPFVQRDVDTIVAATGQRPDLSIDREVRTSIDTALDCVEALGPLIDPNEHSCGSVRPHGARELAHPEPNFYIIGSKSYGRAPTFLLATGYEQARSVAAMLAGDTEAALRVELDLPETGVCKTDFAGPASSGGGCCGPTPTKKSCC